MRRLLGFAAVVLISTACGSAQPTTVAQQAPIAAATPSEEATPTPSASATHDVLPLESCGAAQQMADGNVRPILCADGHPSQAADSYFRAIRPNVTVLELGAGASLSGVEAAMCTDKRVSQMTNPMEESAYTIRAAEVGWNYGSEPVTWLGRQVC